MSRGGEIAFEWAGEERSFRLRIGELRQLQEACNAGPVQVLRRIEADEWRVDDLRETLKLGLIGGGMKPDAAGKLIRRYVDEYDWPLVDHVLPARAVLMAAISGVPDEPLEASGEPQPGEAKAAGGDFPSPPSTPPAPSSDGLPKKSID